MIQITIKNNFRNSQIFKTICEDFGGVCLNNTITFPDKLTFSKTLKLFPEFFSSKWSYYLDIKEIKQNENISTTGDN